MLKALNRSSLKLQLVVLIGLLSLICALLFSWLASGLTRSHLARDQNTLLVEVASRLSGQLAQDIRTRSDELRFVAQMDLMRDPSRSTKDKRDLLTLLKATYPFYAWVGLTDPNGTLIASTEPRLDGVSVAQREWFIHGREGLSIEDAHDAVLLQRYLPAPQKSGLPLRLVDIATPIHDAQGVLIGVLAAHLSLDWAYEARQQMMDQLHRQDFELVVLNHHNKLLLASETLRALPDGSENLSVVAKPQDTEPRVAVETWSDGQRYLTAAATEPDNGDAPNVGWTVLVRVPEAVTSAHANQLSTTLLTTGLINAVVFSLLMWWILSRQLAPLERINAAAQRLRHDELAGPIPDLKGNSEVAVFARSLTELVNARKESQERFRRLFEHAPVAMTLLAREGRVLAHNIRFDRLFGFAHSEIPHADDWFRLVFPEEGERVRAQSLWKSALEKTDQTNRDIGASEHRVTTREGLQKVVQISGIVLDDGVLISFHDVTRLRRAELRVRLWAEAFEQSQLGLLITDARNHQIVAVNPAFARERGYEREAMTGLPVAQLLPPDRAADFDSINAALAIDTHGLFETEHITRTGYRFPVLLDATVLRNEKDEAIHRVVFAWNMTEHKQAEQEVRRLNAELEQRVASRTADLLAANRELDAFAYSVSHDLRAPLRTMNGFAQILSSEFGDQLPSDGVECIDRILKASQRMGDLIEGILTLSHSGRGELSQEPVDISALAAKRLAELAHNEPERLVSADIAPGLTVCGDPRMLDVVMSNLLGNAWKYSAKNPQARIRVFAGEVRGVSGICVADNGAGFDMAHAEKLFQPFQRLHRQTEFAGTGVGLATVQRIVERHGGQIVADAACGQGATFCFSLPPSA